MTDNRILVRFQGKGEKPLIAAIKKLAQAQERLAKAQKKVNDEQENGRKGARLLDNAFATLRSKILLFNFAMAMGVRQLIDFTKQAAKVTAMKTAFNTLSGATEDSSIALQKLKNATNGTMTQFDLFQQANNAMILGVSRNSDEMAEMFDIAQRLGRALGRDTKSSVESLITGIGRQSRLMLDNIGIIVKADEAYEKYAEKLDVTVDSLTDAQKKQAFLNATMESARSKVADLGEETRNAQEDFDALAATLSDFAIEIGNRATPTLQALANTINNLFKTDSEKLLETLQRLNVDPAFQLQLKAKIEEEAFQEFEKDMESRLTIMAQGLSRSEALNIFGAFGKLTGETNDFALALSKVDERLEEIKSDKIVLPDEEALKMAETEVKLKAIQQMLLILTGSTGDAISANEELVESFEGVSVGTAGVSKAYELFIKQQKDAFKQSIQAGMAFDNAGLAAESNARKQIQSYLSTAIAGLIQDAIIKLGWIGVPLAASAGSVIGSLAGSAIGQAGRHWKFEDGGLIGGRRHSQGGTMIEAEQGEYVMSRNAVDAVGIETMNRINAGGGAGGVNISFTGNVMSQDFIENEAIPQIKEAIRRGADIGVS